MTECKIRVLRLLETLMYFGKEWWPFKNLLESGHRLVSFAIHGETGAPITTTFCLCYKILRRLYSTCNCHRMYYWMKMAATQKPAVVRILTCVFHDKTRATPKMIFLIFDLKNFFNFGVFILLLCQVAPWHYWALADSAPTVHTPTHLSGLHCLIYMYQLVPYWFMVCDIATWQIPCCGEVRQLGIFRKRELKQ